MSCVTFIFGYEVFIRKLFLNSYIINGPILYLFLFKELFFSLLPELFHIVRIHNDSYTYLMTCYLHSFNLLNMYLLWDIFLASFPKGHLSDAFPVGRIFLPQGDQVWMYDMLWPMNHKWKWSVPYPGKSLKSHIVVLPLLCFSLGWE